MVKFMYAMANSEGTTSGYDLTTSEGVWRLLLSFLEEAAVGFTDFVAHPHTVWGVSTHGWLSVTPSKRGGGGGGGANVKLDSQQTAGVVKEEKKDEKKKKKLEQQQPGGKNGGGVKRIKKEKGGGRSS